LSLGIKKWANIRVTKGIIAISKPAIPEDILNWPLAISRKGKMLPMTAKMMKWSHGSREPGSDLPFKKAINIITKEPIRSLYPTTCSGEKDKRLRLIRRNDDPQIKINKVKSK